MQIQIEAAYALAEAALIKGGFGPDEAKTIAGQTVGCELRGAPEGGFSRILSIVETRRALNKAPKPMKVLRDTPVSALIDGGDQVGYLVADKAVKLACEKAKACGVGIVAANNTWYTGMYAHYLEAAANEGLVAFCCGSSSPRVAPHGSSQARFGTNPVAFAFPTDGDPIVLDLATSGMIVADAVIAARNGQQLPEGFAFDAEGHPTTDPQKALEGAFSVWGGHRGSGLAIVVQLLGILAGGGAMPEDYKDCGFFTIVFRPGLFMDEAEFRAKAQAYAETVRQARPLSSGTPIRMPFDRSAAHRRASLQAGHITISPRIYEAVKRLVETGTT